MGGNAGCGRVRKMRRGMEGGREGGGGGGWRFSNVRSGEINKLARED